ncbi:MAG: DUF2497 domain-containing protein [Rhizobiaceae bacterium]|nr:DUF2497 domain-containing protein [Rhizobiaceae bacterium]
MAQASSAQREPSMEEILASIRRIIEDNDAAGRRPASEPAPVRQAPVERTVIEVEEFRGGQRAQPEPPIESAPLQGEAESPKPSLAEIKAQIASEAAAIPQRWMEAEPQPQPEMPVFAERVPERSDYNRSADDIRRAIENSRAAREGARALLDLPEPANTARPSEIFRNEPEHAVEPEAHAEPVAPVMPAQNRYVDSRPAETRPAEARHEDSDTSHAKPALLSERVERQVAASFSELSEAFAARSRRTFDEMAEEMIAPLLRDWMENNLPTLVERLVREEIERVARGA